ncbi:HSP20-like chaperone, partial [Tuber borchii]
QHQTQKTFFTPAFDFLETKNEYILEGELPGLHDKKRTVIEFTDAQTVSIRGKIDHREETKKNKEEGDKVWAAERSVGEFRRDFTFPGSINAEGVGATLEYGVLRIVVPKAVEVRAKRILI